MPAIVAHDALWLAGGARSVENIKRVGCRNSDTVGLSAACPCLGGELAPVVIAAPNSTLLVLGASDK